MLRKKSARKLARQWKRHTYSALGDFAEKGKLSTDIQDEIKIQFRDHATNNQERAELARPWRYFRQFKEQTRISEVGRCAFPGGYPIVYFHISERGSSADTLCFDCALETAKDIDNGDESGTIDYQTDEESQYHGGTFCEGCNTCIVDPVCCECISELTTKKCVLLDEEGDTALCLECAAILLTKIENGKPVARRIPGRGIEILATIDPPRYGWDYGTPWYAKPGTIYQLRSN